MGKLREPTISHKKLAEVAAGAAKMHRSIAAHADAGMEERILRAIAGTYPNLRLKPITVGARLRRLAAHIAAEVWVISRPGETIPADRLLKATDVALELIANELSE